MASKGKTGQNKYLQIVQYCKADSTQLDTARAELTGVKKALGELQAKHDKLEKNVRTRAAKDAKTRGIVSATQYFYEEQMDTKSKFAAQLERERAVAARRLNTELAAAAVREREAAESAATAQQNRTRAEIQAETNRRQAVLSALAEEMTAVRDRQVQENRQLQERFDSMVLAAAQPMGAAVLAPLSASAAASRSSSANVGAAASSADCAPAPAPSAEA